MKLTEATCHLAQMAESEAELKKKKREKEDE